VRAEIVFDRAGKRYVVRCRKWPVYLDNLRAAERTIYYLYRAISEYGVSANEGSIDALIATVFAGFEALPDDTVLALGSGQQSWWQILGVTEKATKAEIISAYRALARVHHPDTGGDAETFKRLRRAYEQGMEARSGVAA